MFSSFMSPDSTNAFPEIVGNLESTGMEPRNDINNNNNNIVLYRDNYNEVIVESFNMEDLVLEIEEEGGSSAEGIVNNLPDDNFQVLKWWTKKLQKIKLVFVVRLRVRAMSKYLLQKEGRIAG